MPYHITLWISTSCCLCSSLKGGTSILNAASKIMIEFFPFCSLGFAFCSKETYGAPGQCTDCLGIVRLVKQAWAHKCTSLLGKKKCQSYSWREIWWNHYTAWYWVSCEYSLMAGGGGRSVNQVVFYIPNHKLVQGYVAYCMVLGFCLPNPYLYVPLGLERRNWFNIFSLPIFLSSILWIKALMCSLEWSF